MNSITHFANDDPVQQRRRGQYYFLVGDAAFLAHYRLGVGVNAIFTEVPQLTQLLDATLQVRPFPRIGDVEELNRKALTLVEHFINFQLSTMFFESFCDFIVFFNSDPTQGPVEVFRSQVLYYRDPDYGDYTLPMLNWTWTGEASAKDAEPQQQKIDETASWLYSYLVQKCSK